MATSSHPPRSGWDTALVGAIVVFGLIGSIVFVPLVAGPKAPGEFSISRIAYTGLFGGLGAAIGGAIVLIRRRAMGHSGTPRQRRT